MPTPPHTAARPQWERYEPRQPETRVYELLGRRGWTYKDLAFESGLSLNTVRRVAMAELPSDLANIPLRVLCQLAGAFNMSVAGLYPRLRRRELCE